MSDYLSGCHGLDRLDQNLLILLLLWIREMDARIILNISSLQLTHMNIEYQISEYLGGCHEFVRLRDLMDELF